MKKVCVTSRTVINRVSNWPQVCWDAKYDKDCCRFHRFLGWICIFVYTCFDLRKCIDSSVRALSMLHSNVSSSDFKCRCVWQEWDVLKNTLWLNGIHFHFSKQPHKPVILRRLMKAWLSNTCLKKNEEFNTMSVWSL